MILNDCQYGFKEIRPPTDSLVDTIETITCNLENYTT